MEWKKYFFSSNYDLVEDDDRRLYLYTAVTWSIQKLRPRECIKRFRMSSFRLSLLLSLSLPRKHDAWMAENNERHSNKANCLHNIRSDWHIRSLKANLYIWINVCSGVPNSIWLIKYAPLISAADNHKKQNKNNMRRYQSHDDGINRFGRFCFVKWFHCEECVIV